ncbi:MAG: hypothetical protein KGS48_09895 [Bacteroidetes bacterium]|nr:hypothetical protein [Bacteroidota bacterium]
MKNFSFVLILICANAIQICAQKDTVFIQSSTVIENGENPVALVEGSKELLRLQEPVNTLFKLNLLALSPVLTGRDPFIRQVGVASFNWPIEFQAALEQKLGKAYSLSLGFSSTLFSGGESDFGIATQSGNYILRDFGVQAEARWYFQMKNRVKTGVQASNLSGAYLGANIRWKHYRDAILHYPVNDVYGGYLLFGIQHRLFKRGYFDLGYGFGASQTEKNFYTGLQRKYNSVLRLQLGFALSNPKPQAAQSTNYCEVLHCFREEKRMFKINLIGVLSLDVYPLLNVLIVNPNIAWEEKIGSSAFSVETGLFTDLSFFGTRSNKNHSGAVVSGNAVSVSLSVQPRFYFDQKHRIATGIAGNNLNGLYLGWNNLFEKRHSKFNSSFSPNTSTQSTEYTTGFVVGCQYRFLRKGFVDLNMGAGQSFYHVENVGGGNNSSYNRRSFAPLARFRVGLAF